MTMLGVQSCQVWVKMAVLGFTMAIMGTKLAMFWFKMTQLGYQYSQNGGSK